MDQNALQRARRIQNRKTRVSRIVAYVGIPFLVLTGYLISQNMVPDRLSYLFFSFLSLFLAAIAFGRLVERNSLKKKYLFYIIVNIILISTVTILSFSIDSNTFNTSPATIVMGILLIQAGLNGIITKSVFIGRGSSVFDNYNISIVINLIFIVIGIILIGTNIILIIVK